MYSTNVKRKKEWDKSDQIFDDEASFLLCNDRYLYDIKYEKRWAAATHSAYVTGLQQARTAIEELNEVDTLSTLPSVANNPPEDGNVKLNLFSLAFVMVKTKNISRFLFAETMLLTHFIVLLGSKRR